MIYTPGGIMGLGSTDPAQRGLCTELCDTAGFAFPDKSTKIGKCVSACQQARNVGNCDGQCNPRYNQNSNRNRCTDACQSSFVPKPPPSAADVMANGGALPNGMPVAVGMGLGTKLMIGGAVVVALYVGYRLLKG